jgi:hypothetical protein
LYNNILLINGQFVQRMDAAIAVVARQSQWKGIIDGYRMIKSFLKFMSSLHQNCTYTHNMTKNAFPYSWRGKKIKIIYGYDESHLLCGNGAHEKRKLPRDIKKIVCVFGSR